MKYIINYTDYIFACKKEYFCISKSKACQSIENKLQVFKSQSSVSLNVWNSLMTISNKEITMFLERRQVNTSGSIVWSFHFSLSKIVLLLVLEGPDNNTKFNLHYRLFYQLGGIPLHKQWLSDSYTNGQREIVKQYLTWKILIQEPSLLFSINLSIRSRRIVIKLWTEVSDGPNQPSSQLNWIFLQQCRTASQECVCLFVRKDPRAVLKNKGHWHPSLPLTSRDLIYQLPDPSVPWIVGFPLLP